jgi:hypothetical protein
MMEYRSDGMLECWNNGIMGTRLNRITDNEGAHRQFFVEAVEVVEIVETIEFV